MKPIELEFLRKMLFFSIAEAAEEIGNVSERTWRHWESGKKKIPDDVINKIYILREFRGEILDIFNKKQDDDLFSVVAYTKTEWLMLDVFTKIDSYISPILYRPYCSAVATKVGILSLIGYEEASENEHKYIAGFAAEFTKWCKEFGKNGI